MPPDLAPSRAEACASLRSRGGAHDGAAARLEPTQDGGQLTRLELPRGARGLGRVHRVLEQQVGRALSLLGSEHRTAAPRSARVARLAQQLQQLRRHRRRDIAIGAARLIGPSPRALALSSTRPAAGARAGGGT
eukprot:1525418-Prymnesium_polylepis.1